MCVFILFVRSSIFKKCYYFSIHLCCRFVIIALWVSSHHQTIIAGERAEKITFKQFGVSLLFSANKRKRVRIYLKVYSVPCVSLVASSKVFFRSRKVRGRLVNEAGHFLFFHIVLHFIYIIIFRI